MDRNRMMCDVNTSVHTAPIHPPIHLSTICFIQIFAFFFFVMSAVFIRFAAHYKAYTVSIKRAVIDRKRVFFYVLVYTHLWCWEWNCLLKYTIKCITYASLWRRHICCCTMIVSPELYYTFFIEYYTKKKKKNSILAVNLQKRIFIEFLWWRFFLENLFISRKLLW